jgi:hypothetical protein
MTLVLVKYALPKARRAKLRRPNAPEIRMSDNILKDHPVSAVEKALSDGLAQLLGRTVSVKISGLTFEAGDDFMFEGHMKAADLSISVNRKWQPENKLSQ